MGRYREYYDGATVYLDRKHNKFNEYIDMVNKG